MPKRKASFAFPYERPSKLTKRTSSTTVSKTLSSISKMSSVVKPPLKMPKFPSLRASKVGGCAQVSASAPLPHSSGSPTPPALRRASTLTLEDDDEADLAKSSKSGRKTPSLSKPSSLSKKSSSFVEKGALVTRLSGLKSGSIVGETSLASTPSLTKNISKAKSLSRKSSSVKSTESSSSRIPSLPSGLTKLVLPSGSSKAGSLHVSVSTLVSDIDETEMSSALESLKTNLSKQGSKKGSVSKSASIRSSSSALENLKTNLSKQGSKKGSMSKSASVRSRSSIVKIPSVHHDDDAMDTSTASTSSDKGSAGMPSSDQLMEVAISFDTTGSMYSSLEEVKAKVQDLVQRLQTDIPGIRVAIIAHGDYCDAHNYVVKWIDFGASLPELCDFVNNVERTSGGDGPECYELVLQRSREVLSWTEGSKRILVMIGDDVPHEPGYTYGGKTYHIDWREECASLKEMDVKIYSVQANRGWSLSTKFFYAEMARLTGGKSLRLTNFNCLFDILMMICYREGNPEMLAIYEQEIIDRGERVANDITLLKKTFDTNPTGSSSGPMFPLGGLDPTVPGTIPLFSPLGPSPPPPSLFGGFGMMAKGKQPKKKSPKAEKGTLKKSVKPVKARKVAKAGKKTKKQVGKLNKSVTVQKREKLPDSCMNKGVLKTIIWSKWINCVEPNMPTTSRKEAAFVKLYTNQGYGLKTIFDNDFKTPAIFEVAVQLPGSRKKYVVYFRMTKRGFNMRGHWSTNLLRHKKIREEVNRVLSQGCSIFIRRGVPKAKKLQKYMPQMKAANDYIRDNFDYAWKKYIWRRSEGGIAKFGLKHRLLTLTRKRIVLTLSDNTV